MPRLLPFASLALLALTGCAAHERIDGRIVEGKVSFVGLVDPNDPRLKDTSSGGVGGVMVSGRTVVENQSGVNVGQATSEPNGVFHLTVKEQSAFSRPIRFDASQTGYIPASGVVPFPPADRRVLIILQPRP